MKNELYTIDQFEMDSNKRDYNLQIEILMIMIFVR